MFAWKEIHQVDGEEREVIVHRKGATPAGAGVLGIIPGSMASPGYVVRDNGLPQSLHSASHGAGRIMSRAKAIQSFTWSATRKLLAELQTVTDEKLLRLGACLCAMQVRTASFHGGAFRRIVLRRPETSRPLKC